MLQIVQMYDIEIQTTAKLPDLSYEKSIVTLLTAKNDVEAVVRSALYSNVEKICITAIPNPLQSTTSTFVDVSKQMQKEVRRGSSAGYVG